MPAQMPPGERKFQTEFTLVVSVEGAYLLRPQDLEQVPADTLDESPPCHLYVVSRSPRVTIDPATVTITRDRIAGTVAMQVGGDVQERPFALRHQLGANGLTWQSQWPHEEYSIVDADGLQVHAGVCWLVGSLADFWPPQAFRQEVLYVGQAFGSSGERTAWDRIKKHETLQRILADQLPDTQVWLTMAAIVDVQLMSEIAPQPGLMTDQQDDDHVAAVYRKFNGEGFDERESVALAEAGLIRGWQPEYNDRMKHNFPARKQVSMDTVRGLDLHGLIVEWQSTQLPSWYWCNHESGAKLFFFGYKVHLDPERANTLTLRNLDRPLLAGTRFALGRGSESDLPDESSEDDGSGVGETPSPNELGD